MSAEMCRFPIRQAAPVDGKCLTEGALKHITCTIEDGSFVLLCGASGCGKTTLTRLLNGLTPITTREFYVRLSDGERLRELSLL